MTSRSKPSLPKDTLAFEPEAAVAWAQRRHAMLDRLAALGMRLAEEVVERVVESPYDPEPKHEPVKAYDKVARAVRLTLVLQARTEAEIIALRNGEPMSSVVAPEPEPEASVSPEAPMRERARDAVADAIDLEMPDGEAAEHALDRLRENLIDRETYDDLLTLPFRDCVAAICADLGLDPDWSQWSEETGFAEHAELLRHERRRDLADGRETAETVRQYVAARRAPADAPLEHVVQFEPG
jgi:hypothetical protein